MSLLWFLSPQLSLAQGGDKKSGVKPQVISLPSGPGSLEGLGESFEPDLSTGAASYPYPLVVAPGVKGFQPELSLIYNGGNPNGAWGLGWKLNTPYIQRQTDKGLPNYTMDDRFIFNTGEELVPIGNNLYRFENESSNLPQDVENVRFADLTGDRVQDLAVVREGYFSYYPHNGAGNYEPERLLSNAPVWLSADEVDDLLLGDVNNDGLADIIQPRSGQVRYWLNLGNDRFADYLTIPAAGDTTTTMPELIPGQTSVELGDMNGDGSADLVYGQPNNTIQYIDFNTGTQPNLLTSIDNGLGRTIHIGYQPSTTFYVADQDAGDPWQTTLPFPMQAVSRVSVHDANSGDDYTIDYRYRDGYYDGEQKEFRGFARVTETRYGDDTAAATITEYVYNTGAAEESRKGMILEKTVLGEGGQCNSPVSECYRREVNQLTTRILHTGSDARLVAYSFITQTDTYLYENLETPAQLRQTYNRDAYGNLTREFNFGQVCGDDVACGDDEILKYAQYALNTGAWLLNLPAVISQTDAAGIFVSEQRFYYDGAPYTGLPLGQVERGDLTRQTESLGPLGDNRFIPTKRQAFDAYGNAVGIKDANGNLTTVEYDALVHTFPVLERLHLDSGQTLSYAASYHLGFGQATAATDYNGNPSAYVYDSFGRLSKIILPGDSLAQPTQQFTYTLGSPRSSIATVQREQSGADNVRLSVIYFDGLGRKLQTRSEAEDGKVAVEEALTFNARQGERDKYLPYFDTGLSYAPPSPTLPHTTQYYDPLVRAIRVDNPDNSFSSIIHRPLAQIQYDEEDNNAASLHANTPKTLAYDGLERLVGVQEVNRLGGQTETYTTAYRYDPLGNLTQIVDAQGNVKTMQYDAHSRKVAMDDPDKGTMAYRYDDAGNLIETEDAKGQVISYTYDAANRPLAERWVLSDSTVITHVRYHYDYDLSPQRLDAQNTLGQLSYIEDQTGALYFSFDARGNVTGQIRRFSDENLEFVTRMTYDAMDRLVEVTYPDGMTTTFEYNTQNLLESIPGYLDDVDYIASGQRDTATYPDGVNTSYAYDSRLRLRRLQSLRGQTALQDLTYAFDGVSNIASISDNRPGSTPDNDQTQTFAYDALYRLTNASGSYGQIDYAYDSIGNMSAKTSSAADPRLNLGEMRYGENGAGPHALTYADGEDYRYDRNGNLRQKGDLSHIWDSRDRLLLTADGVLTVAHAYDAEGQRVRKTVTQGGVSTTTLYLGQYAEVRGDQLIQYIFADEGRVAQVSSDFDPARLIRGFADDGASPPDVPRETQWYLSDHLGGTNLLLDETGQLVSEVAYYPYGLTRYEVNAEGVPYRYTGKELDETDLYYYGARFYDAKVGRFLSVDPLYAESPGDSLQDAQNLNLYAYALGNPIKYIDPDGNEADKPNLLKIAEAEKGTQEYAGSEKHNNKIVQYHQTTTLKATDDETPWCSSFANWVVEKSGLGGTKSAAAKSWLSWGFETDSPQSGDIVVLSRGKNGGHVGFYLEDTSPDKIRVLGGNQSDQVKESNYSKARVLGYRSSSPVPISPRKVENPVVDSSGNDVTAYNKDRN